MNVVPVHSAKKVGRNDTHPTLEMIMNAYLLKDDYRRDEELAYSMTPHLVDDLERKLCSLWRHSDDRLKEIVEPAIKELRANLYEMNVVPVHSPAKVGRNDTHPTLEMIMNAYLLKDGYARVEELACSLTPDVIDDVERKLRSLWKHNPYRIEHVVEPAIKELRANLYYE